MDKHPVTETDDHPGEETTTAESRRSGPIAIKDGLWWPEQDQIAYKVILEGVGFLQEAVALCESKRLVIQAGGNAGLYPLALASIFEQVVTFEPEIVNYRCLAHNTRCQKNVTAHHAALGACQGGVSLAGWLPNCGAYRVAGEGDIPQMTIDDLHLGRVDFIQLDVEGYELQVLIGAEETLIRDRPVIMVEDVGHGQSTHGFLIALGYGIMLSNSTDKVYVHKGNG